MPHARLSPAWGCALRCCLLPAQIAYLTSQLRCRHLLQALFDLQLNSIKAVHPTQASVDPQPRLHILAGAHTLVPCTSWQRLQRCLQLFVPGTRCTA